MIILTYLLIIFGLKMLSSSQDVLLKLSKTTSPQKSSGHVGEVAPSMGVPDFVLPE